MSIEIKKRVHKRIVYLYCHCGGEMKKMHTGYFGPKGLEFDYNCLKCGNHEMVLNKEYPYTEYYEDE